ncbi:SDR family NAD(P)-dependent oxidoreductase [Streptomyces triculaminicus]|uniref:SDR family NAD(P)-dependent oxidoreductase n=2 Tax=Streptomyces TaxID=1883 RepID=A0A939FU71_9ACTN|nr:MULTISPECIES: oxidoreductase [Streptomyces]MBO0656793.1 SDR family NAD(P)-dependent oxidoreductase [Streptomyces triculaminicus]QSY47774.1 SDR family NAD(P)-dependent oxidoreductase [Streptomyces griseocarneus]
MSGRQGEGTGEGRVWFVTGTSSGFGREIARAVIAHGDRVVATARDVAAVEDLVALAPGRVRAVALDVTDDASIRRAVAEAETGFGRIDVLVNNAGAGLLGAFEELSDSELRRNFETNLFGAMAVTRAVLPVMRHQRAGRIVQMSSVIGVIAGPGGTAYAGTKFALEGMSEALAAEVAHLGIRVTIVEPGPFRTDFGGRSLRWGTPMEDYAELMGPARAALEASHGSQSGDPYRGAEAIIAAVGLEEPPLRLPLGAEAFAWIRAHLRARLEQLDAVEEIGADTAFR